jgi:hypothetical protein
MARGTVAGATRVTHFIDFLSAYCSQPFYFFTPLMTPESLRQLEYGAMRATIRERGTARLVLVPVIFVAWAATSVATAAVITVALSTLVPLIILAAGFEAIFALHTNVERIGRYLQVYHEPDGGWEHVAMEFGRRFPGGGPDPLFGRLFTIAVSLNYLPAALGGTLIELSLLAVVHLALILRFRLARLAAGRQRQEDLERFLTLKGESHAGLATPEP